MAPDKADWLDCSEDISHDESPDQSEAENSGEGEPSSHQSAADFFGAVRNPNLPIPILKTAREIRSEARERSRNIVNTYRALRAIVQRHEATIQKRWASKTRQQRLKILLSAWPNMAPCHRPDFEAFRREMREVRRAGTQFREAFVWPYINQQDLAKVKPLLLLINARGRNPPSDFSAADFSAMHFGVVWLGIPRAFLNEHVMMLHGVSSAREYGKLVHWDDHKDAFDWYISGRQPMPGDGLLILEAQERILGFLLECCCLILHDISEDTMLGAAFPILPEPKLKRESEDAGFESLAVMAAEAPYRLPSKLDLDRIESLLAAKTAAAEDHIWSLREDPAYFADELLDARDHRQEMLRDANGMEHPLFRLGREGVFWSRVISSTVANAYLGLEGFYGLHQQAQALQVLRNKYEADISPAEDLPEEYLDALLVFRFSLQQAAKASLNMLKHTTATSPPMRRLFIRSPPLDSDATTIEIQSRPGSSRSNVEEQLLWLLTTLWQDDYDLFLTRLPLAMDELERLIDTEREAKDLISPRVASIIADLSIVGQCMGQIDLYQPWASSFESEEVNRKDKIHSAYRRHIEGMGRINSSLGSKSFDRAAVLGTPTQGKFKYPVNKRRTKESVAIMRQSEDDLDRFWAWVDELMHGKAGNLEGTGVYRLLSQDRVLQRTPEWVEPAKGEPTKSKAAKGKTKGKPSKDHPTNAQPAEGQTAKVPRPVREPSAVEKPFSEFFFQLSERAPGSKVRDIAPKTKVKTRDTPYQEPEPAAALEEDTHPGEVAHDTQPRFAVDARALKAFRTLFFNPDVTSSPGEVSWADFLHAMASTGFVAEKLYGSAWQFRPKGVDGKRPIQFHEPHPRGKLQFVVARRYGRRLSRAYGWFGGMFVLKEKSA